MSTIKKFTVGDKNFTFHNNWRSNRSGFVHETELFQNERLMATNKSQYYNRTWESYEYQSSMRACVQNAIAGREADLLEGYRQKMGKKRVTQPEKDLLWAQDEQISILCELQNQL